MMWEKCIPSDLYKYICKNDNFMLLNQLELTYQRANEIIKIFIKENPNGLQNLQKKLINISWFINMFIALFSQNVFLSTKKKSVLQINLNLSSPIKNGLIPKRQHYRQQLQNNQQIIKVDPNWAFTNLSSNLLKKNLLSLFQNNNNSNKENESHQF